MYHFVEPWRASFQEIAEFLTGHQADVADDRVLATVLFTDIVDSTRRAAEMGDRDWHALLDAHDAVVRAQLARFRGREVNTSGDGFLAMFDGPQRAIRCAMAIRDAVQALGIEVRAGLHTGECEVRGDDIGGIAVHIGARVSALAGPNEVLVSSTLRDLVIGSGLEFEDARHSRAQGCARRMASLRRRVLERWGFVSFGDGFGGVVVVESSLGGDGFGFVAGAGVSTFGHHRCAVVVGVDGGRVVVPQGGCGLAQLWEQVLAARIRDIGVPGWCGPHDGAHRQFPGILPLVVPCASTRQLPPGAVEPRNHAPAISSHSPNQHRQSTAHLRAAARRRWVGRGVGQSSALPGV